MIAKIGEWRKMRDIRVKWLLFMKELDDNKRRLLEQIGKSVRILQ